MENKLRYLEYMQEWLVKHTNICRQTQTARHRDIVAGTMDLVFD